MSSTGSAIVRELRAIGTPDALEHAAALEQLIDEPLPAAIARRSLDNLDEQNPMRRGRARFEMTHPSAASIPPRALKQTASDARRRFVRTGMTLWLQMLTDCRRRLAEFARQLAVLAHSEPQPVAREDSDRQMRRRDSTGPPDTPTQLHHIAFVCAPRAPGRLARSARA